MSKVQQFFSAKEEKALRKEGTEQARKEAAEAMIHQNFTDEQINLITAYNKKQIRKIYLESHSQKEVWVNMEEEKKSVKDEDYIIGFRRGFRQGIKESAVAWVIHVLRKKKEYFCEEELREIIAEDYHVYGDDLDECFKLADERYNDLQIIKK